MPLHDLNEFLRLSSNLNYNLSAASLNRYNILMFILGKKQLHENPETDKVQKSIAMETLGYLLKAYSEKKRRLGPDAVIHPLRSAALFCIANKNVRLPNLLVQLFHDVLEDIQSRDFSSQKWRELEEELFRIFDRLEPEEEAVLREKLLYLTRLRHEQYYEYIGRLLSGARKYPDLVAVKLTDRLDNTLDMRIGDHDPLEGVNFFQEIFQLLFVNSFTGHIPEDHQMIPLTLNAARRMYQLFKNAVLLSLIRQKYPDADSEESAPSNLFNAVAKASLLEAQRIFIKTIGYHLTDVSKQRELLIDAMEYCYSGKTELVTEPGGDRILDGLFTTYFAISSKTERKQKLDSLYSDKPLMLEASVAFTVIFFSFLNSPDFFVQGVSTEGIEPALNGGR